MEQLFLDRNENLYGPAPACLDLLKNLPPEIMSTYSRDNLHGSPGALATRLARVHGVPDRHILPSYGSEDMLKLIVQDLLAPGRKVLIPEYSWWYYRRLAEERGGVAVSFAVRDTGREFIYDAGDIMSAVRVHRPEILILASPNNPTGHVISKKDLSELLGALPEVTIVLDQAYAGFAPEGLPDPGELIRSHERLVVLRTFSKYYALAGARIGYAVAGGGLEHLSRMATRYLGINRLSEALALAALDSPEYYRRITERLRGDLRRWTDRLAALPGHDVYRSDANFLLVRVTAPIRTRLVAELPGRGVYVKFLDDPGLTDAVRITMGTETQNSRAIAAWLDVVERAHALVDR
jgi:histidinol-phosphate aminotransferase